MSDLTKKEHNAMNSVSQYTQMIEKIDLSELPAIIDSQVEQIEILGDKIEKALSAADAAKAKTDEAHEVPVRRGHRKEAIKKLQEAGKKSAEAIGETAEALKVSFDYEKQLGEISKFLLAIASCSVVHTEQAIKKINDAIQNRAANKPLNETAKERLQQIVIQMKAQGETIKRMEEKDAQDEEQNRQIKKMVADDDRQDALIADLQNQICDLKKWKIVTLVISGVAVLLTLLNIVGVL